ncbi:MAG TPA: alkaline phosphatase D family protein [Iamia sp.]
MNAGGTEGERSLIGRRQLIVGAAALTALAACGDDGDGGRRSGSSTSTTAATSLGPTTTRHAARLAGDPFGLGVASGDPRADSVILWTRLAPTPRSEGDRSGMPADPVDIVWEVATDDRFRAVVAQGVATAEPDAGHSVHVDAGGLDPASDYHYRFTVGEWTSEVGRTRTLAAPGEVPARFALAVANCQWIDSGRYAAYRGMLDEDLDLVLHLGDYVYEYPGARALPNRIPETVDDWRLRYASYRSDDDLRAAHARFPFVCTWDDHEVRNNHMGDTAPLGLTEDQVREAKTVAYRGWWENIPTRMPPPDGSDLPIFQHLDIGDLARLYVLDERQDSDVPPCRDEVSDDYGDCDARTGSDRTRLGSEQEEWFASATSSSTAAWNLVGNPVVLAGVDAGAADGESAFYLDTWDGFPDARQRVIEALAGVDNPVVLTGDYHAGMVLDVHRTPFDVESDVVCTELMAPPISSVLFPNDVSARTPQLRQQLNEHGYLAVELTPDRMTARFQVVADVQDPASAVSTAATWTIDPGSPRATEA